MVTASLRQTVQKLALPTLPLRRPPRTPHQLHPSLQIRARRISTTTPPNSRVLELASLSLASSLLSLQSSLIAATSVGKAATIDLPDRSYTTERKQSSFDTLKMPLSMMKRSEPLALQHEPSSDPEVSMLLLTRSRLLAFQIDAQPSFPEPSPAHAAFLLLAAPPGEHTERIDGRQLCHWSITATSLIGAP